MLPSQSAPSLNPGVLLLARKRELVDRIVNSQTFLRAPRLREFLIYVADCTLEGRLDDVREQQIAQRVFHRKPDYNPGQDNIVRVEARLLRKRLEAYFAEEGVDSSLIITMPKGSYALAFEPRERAETTNANEEQTDLSAALSARLSDRETPPEGLPHDERPSLSRLRKWTWMRPALLGFLAVALVILFLLARRWTGSINPVLLQTLPLSAVINNERETDVVTSDASLIIIQDIEHQRISFNDYINHRYPTGSASPWQELLKSLPYRDYTDAVEVGAANKLVLQAGHTTSRVSMRSARQIGLSDLKERNVILLGSPESNPWGDLYYENLPFQFESSRVGCIRNSKPSRGELNEYFTPTRSGETGDAYAILALVPNISAGGSVLLIAGTTAEATAAAAEFLLDRTQIWMALRRMGIDPAGPPRSFELLLKAKTFPGSATKATVQTWRRIQPNDKPANS